MSAVSRRTDRAFARYRRFGHADDLARVFDATAPMLYRLAWHLTGDRHAAEDLVQTTFLVAIEDRGAHAPGRAVLPWLCGILANRARVRRRRQGVEQAAPKRVPEGERDPGEAAAMRELSDAARTHLHALPEPYRQPCVLHVEHGLSAAEIANALDRPDATVRSQLHRGLDMLRRLLPAALAGGLRAAPAGNLAAMRALVLRHAASAAPVLTLATTQPKGLHPWLAGGALVAGLAAIVAHLVSTPPPPIEASEPPVPASAPALVAEPSLHADGRLAPARAVVVVPRAADPAAVLVVRARWASDASPAAQVNVRFVPAGLDGDLQERVALTDAQGVARFEAPVLGLATLRVDRGGATEIDVRPACLTLADVEVPFGVRVEGRVVDGKQRPVGGALVWLSHDRGKRAAGEIVARSGVDGTFAIRDVEAGRLLAAWSEHCAGSGVHSVAAGEDAHQEIELRLDADGAGRLFGVVVDEAGVALPGAKVALGAADSSSGALPVRTATSDRDGRFEFVGLPLDEPDVSLRACALGRVLATTAITVSAATQVRLTLAPEAIVAGSIVDRDGEPAWRGRVWRDAPESIPVRQDWPAWACPATLPGRDGSYELRHLPAGRHRIRAADGDDIGAAVLVLAPGERTPWSPRLREVSIVGEVVDARGAPLSDWRVAAHALNASRLDAITDRRGTFRLRGADADLYELTVQEPASCLEIGTPAVAVSAVVPGSTPVHVTVPDVQRATARIGAWIETRSGSDPPRLSVRVIRFAPGGGIETGGRDTRVVDGRYRSRMLRPGRYRFQVMAESGLREVGPFDLTDDQELELGTVRFETPGGIDVRVDDVAGVDRITGIGLRSEAAAPGDLRFSVLVDGVARWRQLQPGGYWVIALGETLAGVRVEVQPGVSSTVSLVPAPGVPRLLRVPPGVATDGLTRWRVLHVDGHPLLEVGGSIAVVAGRDLRRRLAPGRYVAEAVDLRHGSVTSELIVTDAVEAEPLCLPRPPRR